MNARPLHPTFLTMAQASRALGLSYQSIQKRVARNTLRVHPFYGTDMVAWSEIEEEVQERRGAGLVHEDVPHA